MEKEQLLEKIGSIYILTQIFDYIQDDNLKLKLFVHSKSLQKKFGIKLIDYKKEFYKKIKFNLKRYLSFNNKENDKDKEYLNNNLQRFLNKINMNKNNFENLLSDIYSNKKVEELEEEVEPGSLDIHHGYLINVFSPLFDVISKTEIFEKKYCIPIYEEFIEKNKLNNDYKSIFEKLNKSNIKYTSILLRFNDNNKINYLTEFNIDFNRIKKLSLFQDVTNRNNKYLFDTLFSFKNIENNLVYLKINLKSAKMVVKTSDSFENINNFKSLKYLYLNSFYFDKLLFLKLTSLELLSLETCINIYLSEDCCSNLKKLRLYIVKSYIKHDYYKKAIKLPIIESCELYHYDIRFDFKSLVCLKYFSGNEFFFLRLKNESLINVKILSELYNLSKVSEINIIKKIIGLQKIKNLELSLYHLNDDDISKIEGENKSLTKLRVIWKKDNENCILINLQKKFLNLSNIEVISSGEKRDILNFVNIKPVININENKNCKINAISLTISIYNINLIQLDCGPFEKLIEIKLILQTKIYNLDNLLPLLGNNCLTIFKSLKVFHFKYDYLSIFDNINNILENIYNNFDKMPNLNEFLLICTCNISEEFYINFLRKMLSSNLNHNFFDIINNEQYNKIELSEADLKKIYPNFDLNKYKNIYIIKRI